MLMTMKSDRKYELILKVAARPNFLRREVHRKNNFPCLGPEGVLGQQSWRKEGHVIRPLAAFLPVGIQTSDHLIFILVVLCDERFNTARPYVVLMRLVWG